MSDSIVGESNEGQRGRGALKFPRQMMPGESGRHGAGDTGGEPVSVRIPPNVPVSAACGFDIALGSEDPARFAVRLIGVELERLSVLRSCQVESDVVFEMGGGVHCAELFPP